MHKVRSAANSTWTYAWTRRGQTSGLEPAASCLPLGCWLRSTSELITNLIHAHIYTDKTKVHEHVNTHSQRQPAVFGACGAVFGFDHLFESHLTGVGAALSLCVSPSFSPLCPLLFLGKRGGVTCVTIYIYSQLWGHLTHTHTHTYTHTHKCSLPPLKAHLTSVKWTEAVTVVFYFMVMQDVWIHNLTNQWRLQLTQPAARAAETSFIVQYYQTCFLLQKYQFFNENYNIRSTDRCRD